jgi:hypothetical protein
LTAQATIRQLKAAMAAIITRRLEIVATNVAQVVA